MLYYFKSDTYPITTLPLLTQSKFNGDTTKTSVTILESDMAISLPMIRGASPCVIPIYFPQYTVCSLHM